MRVMLRAHMDTVATNESIRTGGLPQAMRTLMDRVKPEAAYFGLHEGVRSCWIVFDLQDSSLMPSLMEDLFLQFNAEVEVAPVMNAEDLAKGLAAMKSSP
ncbi:MULTISPECIES: DUF3303 family protein [Streptomyces]|uniref:DUF3303 family protein n=1 Tax=Streptomyces TaxID=1883 RepID=UPI0004CC0057|nr:MULTISPECIES: DUF3303 family protein [Streptomyces]KOU32603.1 hypothetical protein ADK53_21970 [Streptomyces sp. WM6373]KOU68689.1 hypothetical protein ADK96_09035 [Streptomyces sp. IGB124]KOU73934.1 hypothetical protein ADK61_22095 [Streptomyces sp. XY66]KOU84669.1 hypothetical protein ADK93_23735 [Streptomyces sp. XY58]KOV04861.1 hypothetical protein ADK89_21300 [Streptomyces sp. XY37]